MIFALKLYSRFRQNFKEKVKLLGGGKVFNGGAGA
jgi:hypothetical protein